jgi:hypothetical protein
MMEQCHQIQKLMPLMDETARRDVLDGTLKVEEQQMKLAGMLQGSGISVSIGKGIGMTATRTSLSGSRPMRPCFALTSPCRRGRCSNCKKGQSFYCPSVKCARTSG